MIQDTYNNLLRLKSEMKDRNIYVWGAKITGGAISSVLVREHFTNFVSIIDSNTFIQGKELFGKQVISPEEFWKRAGQDKEKPFVIVAAAIRGKEIYTICEEHGMKEEEDFCWADDLLGPVYEIDLTNACNLKCPSCPQSNYPIKHTSAVMSLDRFKSIIKHVKKDTPNVAYIPLFCWTEPFLRKDLAEFAAVLKQEGILGIVSTNFSLDIPHLEEYIRLKPEYFRISFSGFYQMTYERAHRGGDINLVKANMYKLRYLLDKYSPDTFVEIYFHEYNYTPVEELEKWRETCNELQYTIYNHSATVNPLENVMKIMKDEDISNIESVLSTLKFDFRKTKYPDMLNHPEVCYSFKNMFCVTAAGKVIGCDCLYDEKEALLAENIEETTYAELMEAKRKNKMCIECLRMGLPLYNGTLSSNPKKEVRTLIRKIKNRD